MSIQIHNNPHQGTWWWSLTDDATGNVLMLSSIYESEENCRMAARKAERYAAEAVASMEAEVQP